MQTRTIDYFFCVSCVWAFLGHRRFLDLAAQNGVRIHYRPVRMTDLIGSSEGISLTQLLSTRRSYHATELNRWTTRLNIPVNANLQQNPPDEEMALQLLAIADAEGHDIGPLAEALMHALWVENEDISAVQTLIDVASSVGLDAENTNTLITSSEASHILDRNRDRAVSVGVFGAPSYVIDDEIFWGQDRLGQLSEMLAGQGGATGLWRGSLRGIFTAEMGGVEMESLQEVMMEAGVGLQGDRYATAQGYYSEKPHADRQVTLIEEETLDALKRDHGITLLPEETRRNLLTRNVPLNHLVGRRFRVGNVELYGGRLNVPCMYLERLVDRKVFEPLINRSGLNCRILNSGRIHLGDSIVPVD